MLLNCLLLVLIATETKTLMFMRREMWNVNDQRLLLEYMLRVFTGTMNNKFMKKKIG